MDDSAFRGNTLLKRKGTFINWTPERIEELKKCNDDIIYFICKYCKIVSLDRGLVPFELYDYQKEFIKLMHENTHVIATQARQSGKCYFCNTYINIRNKKTGEIQRITIGKFYDMIKQSKNSNKVTCNDSKTTCYKPSEKSTKTCKDSKKD